MFFCTIFCSMNILLIGSENMSKITLNYLKLGKKGIITELKNTGSIRRRLLDMGFTPGTKIECILISPFKDPIAYKVRNAIVALRTEDSKQIEVEVLES